MWWCIAKRASQIHGVFQLMRSTKFKAKTLPERYELLTEKLAGPSLSFIQAAKYDRLGKFLAQYPLFVFQRKWTTLADWFQKIDGFDAVLVDCLPSIVDLSSVFLKDSFLLHTHGFQVFPRMMKDCVADDLIATCKTRCEQHGEPVFNNSKRPDGRLNDKKRVQLGVDRIESVDMTRFKAVLTERLALYFPRHKVDAMVAMLSKLLCKAQLEHTDLSQ
jgi:hypothetical protein